MKPITTLVLVFLLFTGAMAAQQAGQPAALGEGMVNPGYQDKPSWFKHSFLDIREDIGEATESGRRLLLYFYQDGCPYCAKLLNDNFGNRSIAEKTQRSFDVIAINMWGDRDVTGLDGQSTSEKAFATALRVQYTPTLLFMDEQGKTVLRINGYFAPHKFDLALDFVAGRHEERGSFRDFYVAASPVPANTGLNTLGGTLERPLRLDRRADGARPLLVLFEQGSCSDCDVLHADIFKREALSVALSNLDVAQVDIWSTERLQTPDGREMQVRDWTRELGIQHAPSLVFFDAQGNEVFRTEAFLRAFHVHGAIDYVVSGAYRRQPSFQRFLQHRTEMLEARGVHVELMD